MSSRLIDYVVKHYRKVEHSQDLLNMIFRFYHKQLKVDFVPFFVKLYQKDITEIIIAHQKQQKEIKKN